MSDDPQLPHDDDVLSPREVAKLFGVDPKTVTRWARTGQLEAVFTLGGHRRFRGSEVRRLLERKDRGTPQGA